MVSSEDLLFFSTLPKAMNILWLPFLQFSFRLLKCGIGLGYMYMGNTADFPPANTHLRIFSANYVNCQKIVTVIGENS